MLHLVTAFVWMRFTRKNMEERLEATGNVALEKNGEDITGRSDDG